MSGTGPFAGELWKSLSLPGLRRTIWIGVLGALVVTSFAVIQAARFTALGRAEETGGRIGDWPMLVLNMGQVVPVLIGAWVFGQDAGAGPRRLALLAVAGRCRLVAAKMTTVLLLCTVAAILCAGAAVLSLALLGGGPSDASDPPALGRFCWLTAYWVLVGAVSASVTAAARSMAAAIVPVLAWTLGVSDLLAQRVHVLAGALDQVFKGAYLDGTTPTVMRLVSAALQVVVIAAVCLAVHAHRDTG